SFQVTVVNVNAPPTITRISNLTIVANQAGSVEFQVDDDQTPAGQLIVSAVSSSPTLIPNANLILSGSGTKRVLNILPGSGQVGVAKITVTVTDSAGVTQTASFQVTVVQSPVIAVPPSPTGPIGSTVPTGLNLLATPTSSQKTSAPKTVRSKRGRKRPETLGEALPEAGPSQRKASSKRPRTKPKRPGAKGQKGDAGGPGTPEQPR